MTPRLLIARPAPDAVLARARHSYDVVFNEADLVTDRADLLAMAKGADAVIAAPGRAFDGAFIGALPETVRMIATFSVGFDHLDLAAAKARGIVVTNTPDVLTEATADLTWALIMDITRRVSEGDRLVRRGAWKGWALDFMLGTELRGKQLGIVGYGRIGRAVAARAAVFGMRVQYADPQAPAGEALPVDRLLATSDVVSIHCPLTPETRHLINQASLARMKRSAYLINTSRGPVVEEAALVWALKNRIISGAALDVYENEPAVHPELAGLENVVLAPHLGSATTETRTAMADLAVRNAIAVLSGHPAITPVP